MLTEVEISEQLEQTIKSPIRVGNLEALGIDQAAFLAFFKPLFEDLTDDLYLIRQKQMTFLEAAFEASFNAINALHQPYFEGRIDLEALEPWINQLDANQKAEFDRLSVVTRQRNISTFVIDVRSEEPQVKRVVVDDFVQDVEDFRVWKRVFTQATPAAVENAFFEAFLQKIALLVKSIHSEAQELKMTAHFMRTLSQENIPGENAPEGIHEDGAQYIVSALVINRQNITGGESRVFEKPACNNQELLYKKVLQPGEFVFQADTGEELTFGNDLWHNVSPIYPVDISQVGIRDIIGLDIDIVA